MVLKNIYYTSSILIYSPKPCKSIGNSKFPFLKCVSPVIDCPVQGVPRLLPIVSWDLAPAPQRLSKDKQFGEYLHGWIIMYNRLFSMVLNTKMDFRKTLRQSSLEHRAVYLVKVKGTVRQQFIHQ